MLSESAAFLRAGKEMPFDIPEILKRDKETAETLRDILQNSDTPYLNEYGFLDESIGMIGDCINIYNESVENWLLEYHF